MEIIEIMAIVYVAGVPISMMQLLKGQVHHDLDNGVETSLRWRPALIEGLSWPFDALILVMILVLCLVAGFVVGWWRAHCEVQVRQAPHDYGY